MDTNELNEKELPLFKVKDEFVWKYDDKILDYQRLCKKITVKHRLNVLEDDTWYLCIAYHDPSDRLKELTIPQSHMKRLDLLALMDNGIDITESNVVDVRNYLNWCIHNFAIPVKYAHKHLGWYYKDGVRTNTFFLKNAIGEVKSTYIGEYKLTAKGELEEYVSFIKDELLGNPYLQLALVIGLSAPVLSIIADETDMENLFVNFSGNSSTGKSTALALAMSPWGKAVVSNGHGSLVKSWSATENALMKTITSNGIQGHPLAFDEAGTNNIKQMSNFIYKFCSGTDKARLNSDSVFQKNESFRTILISSGEIRIFDQIKEMTLGASIVRLTEFNDMPWTTSAAQSNKIKRFISNHYGVFGKKFIKYLLDCDSNSIISLWNEYTDELVPELEPFVKQFAERISAKLAVFMVTFCILSEVLNVDWDFNEFTNILIESAKDKQDEVKLAEKAYEIIFADVAENRNHYEEYKGNSYNSNRRLPKSIQTSVWGKYNDRELTISRKRFEKLMAINGFKNPKLVLQQLLEKGVLVPETDRNRRNYYNRRTLGTTDKISVVVLKRNILFDDDLSDSE